VVNARISYLYEPAGLRFTVYGKNLTESNYYINRFQTDFATNSLYAAPRTWGMRLSFVFK
jgi:iron complex outermembrane receptor protein